MEQSRQEILNMQERLLAMLPEVQAELQSSFPNVTSVEVGLKRKLGELTDVICFRVIVTKKVNTTDLKKEELIPAEIRGIPTDVLEDQLLVNCSDESGYDLLTGGIQIDAGIGSGTLGCFVTVDAEPAASKKIYLLTNHHVIIGATGVVGTRVGQPSAPSSCKCCMCNDIGVVFSGQVGGANNTAVSTGAVAAGQPTTNAVDAAIAKLLGQDATDGKTVYFSNSIEQIGPVFGSSLGLALHDRVRKRGRTTGLTYGSVEAIGSTSSVLIDKKNPSLGSIVYTNATIRIVPLAENALMANEGDSGSVVVNNQNQVVALIFSVPINRNPDGSITPTGEARAFPIMNVMSRLGVSVLSSGTANSIPLSGISEPLVKPIRASNYINAFEKQLRAIPQGEMFLNILYDHRKEVMDLINDNREVKVAWHRMNGPEYIGHIIKNFSDPQHTVPADINGYSLQNLLIKMSEVLEKNGSISLAKAVDDYSAFAFNFADQYENIDSLTKALKKIPLSANCHNSIHQSNAH